MLNPEVLEIRKGINNKAKIQEIENKQKRITKAKLDFLKR